MKPSMTRDTRDRAAVVAILFSTVLFTGAVAPEVATDNTNERPAGIATNGAVTVHLVARESIWYPEGRSAPGVPVFAFAEAGHRVQIPGPLLRVTAGTEVHVTLQNSLPKMMRVRGLEDHGTAVLDTFDIVPGATREITFRANTPGTFYYWGRTEGDRAGRGYSADSQLFGGFIVDPAGEKRDPRERIMMISLFDDTLRTIPKPDAKEVLAINGLSWPYTERLQYTTGDTVRWRVINFSVAPHPMHLHGFYYDVVSKGNATRDTLYGARQTRKVVTEAMAAGTTMRMQWVPTRPGNWLFHCHLIYHIDASLRLGESSHAAHPNHAEEGMSGLVMGVRVLPRRGGAAVPTEPAAVRKLRMYVDERPNVYRNKPGFAFIVQEGPTAPAADSITLPSSTVVLTKGEPTQVTVINHTHAMAGVHWHGIELNSYYDGVGDWSGWGKKTAPVIAPGDSFVVHMTPDRAGTFIYHTHVDETVQLTSGLYGALIVLNKGEKRDTAERLFLLGDGGPIGNSPPFVNGKVSPDSVNLSAKRTYRFRLINISAGATKRVRLFADTVNTVWRPIAKDGADLPPTQATERTAEFYLMPGETYDVEIKREKPERLTLEVQGPRTTKIPVQVR